MDNIIKRSKIRCSVLKEDKVYYSPFGNQNQSEGLVRIDASMLSGRAF